MPSSVPRRHQSEYERPEHPQGVAQAGKPNLLNPEDRARRGERAKGHSPRLDVLDGFFVGLFDDLGVALDDFSAVFNGLALGGSGF